MEKFKFTKPVAITELFGGIGSQKMAMRDEGFDCYSSNLVEIDKYAVQSYNAIHGTSFEPMDITKVNNIFVSDNQTQHLMTYSFPYQDLSRIGRKAGMEEGSGTRSSLLWEVQRILDELDTVDGLPDVLLMENVTQVHNKSNEASFNKWYNHLDELGYHSTWIDLNASNFGIPQNRKRCYMVSVPKGYSFMAMDILGASLLTTVKDYLETNVDKKYYLSEKMKAYIMDLNEVQKGTKWEGRANNDVLNPEIAHTISVRGAGGCQRAGVSNFILDGYGEITVRELKNKFTKEELLKLPVRRLTPRECWRLMSFSDEDFDKVRPIMSDAQLYKQAGNSIVENVLRAIFREMK